MATLVYIEKYIFLGLRKWNRTELLTSNFGFSKKSRVENGIQCKVFPNNYYYNPVFDGFKLREKSNSNIGKPMK